MIIGPDPLAISGILISHQKYASGGDKEKAKKRQKTVEKARKSNRGKANPKHQDDTGRKNNESESGDDNEGSSSSSGGLNTYYLQLAMKIISDVDGPSLSGVQGLRLASMIVLKVAVIADVRTHSPLSCDEGLTDPQTANGNQESCRMIALRTHRLTLSLRETYTAVDFKNKGLQKRIRQFER
jgi:hypothetical protein